MSIDAEIVELVSLLSEKISQAHARLGTENELSDLTLRQIYLLETIERLSNPTPTELSRELNISKPSVSVAIDKLVAAGYVRKVHSDEDRRSFHIHLTSKAGEVRTAHLQAHQQIAQILVKGLSELDLVEMRRLIAKILAANR